MPGAMRTGMLAYLLSLGTGTRASHAGGHKAREQPDGGVGAAPLAIQQGSSPHLSPLGSSRSVPQCSHGTKVFPDEWIMSKCLPFGY